MIQEFEEKLGMQVDYVQVVIKGGVLANDSEVN